MSIVRTAVFDLFRSHGVNTIFGNPGSTELPMLNEFPADFRYVLGLQEAVVVGMADGYAQISGTTAVVNLHTSAGLGNAMGAVVNAAANRTPMVVTAGQQVRAMMTLEALLTNNDATTLPKPAVKWSYEPPRAQDVPAALARAFHIASTPPTGPVFVSLPMDDFDAEVDESEALAVSTRKVLSRTAPLPGAIQDLARRLSSAVNPVLVLGGDVSATGSLEIAVALSERAGLPVWAAPLEGRLCFPQNHPHFQGFLPPAIALLSAALGGHDLIVVIGAPVFRYYPYLPGAYLPEGATLTHITSDPEEAAKAPVGDAIVGDTRAALEMLTEHVTPSGRKVPPRGRPQPEPDFAVENGRMSPVSVFAALADAAPADTIWVNESPSNTLMFQDRVRIGAEGAYLFTTGGGLGFGLPAAVGAKMADPGRPVVAVMGDGSMHYALPAMWTAAAYGVPLTIVVLTNREYSILKWFSQLEKVSGVPGLDLPGIGIRSIAQGYGLATYQADSREELAAAVSAAVAGRGPTLIEVPITSTVEDLNP
ncbi:benzoylformate decarboxylase [Sinosporangium siamense]|uniref:Benzoylformate decarboxylase n=1 Tax=Sinosporangium siamense TaxID=1367973 RepID=A0A919RED8_9ACTN|nr:benzoylformate decarboxylase [Sinosporangium siamense]GII91872.1 benzoylformate decarboxylase [Sinosporangium siamense]